MSDPNATTAVAPKAAPGPVGLPVELNGINVISEAERKGRPLRLFWPWCAANIAVLGISYGSFFLGFGVSLWQAASAGVSGPFGSSFLVGSVPLAATRGPAQTVVLPPPVF